jgi:choline kinase
MGNRFTTEIKLDSTSSKLKEISVVIPVAGMGHRMKSYGPKCLLPANQKESILEKTIRNIRNEYPNSDIIVVAGFESEKIIRKMPHFVRVVENQNYQETNVVESIRIGINASATDNILLVYGDLVFNVYSIRDIANERSCVVVDSKSRFKDDEIGVTIVDGEVTMFAYGLENKWSQIAYFEGMAYKMLKTLCSDKKKNKLYPFELFNHMINNGIKVKAVEPKRMTIREIDSLKDL